MNRTILVIDDDPVIQQLFTILLRPAGLEVRLAATAEEARKAAIHTHPSAILLDLNLGGTDGLGLTHELSERGAPVIVVSAWDDAQTRERARAAGAADFFSKPVNPRTFAEQVKEHLRRNSETRNHEDDPRERRLRELREQFLNGALASITELASRSDEALLSDSLLADAAHKWVGASSIEGMPDVEHAARDLEALARAHRTDRALYIRERLGWVEEQFTATRQNR